MSETLSIPKAVSFWLDNKIVSAHLIAMIGDQTLVDYRGKFYVIRNGAALMKGSKPLHFSKSSMPLVWKKVLRGEIATINEVDMDDNSLPIPSRSKKVRIKKQKENEVADMQEIVSEQICVKTPLPAVFSNLKTAKQNKKHDLKPSPQASIPANCPYCNQKHDIPMEKGKNGKPFFLSCTKCTTEFAVRFIPVTMFQAQVAGFK